MTKFTARSQVEHNQKTYKPGEVIDYKDEAPPQSLIDDGTLVKGSHPDPSLTKPDPSSTNQAISAPNADLVENPNPEAETTAAATHVDPNTTRHDSAPATSQAPAQVKPESQQRKRSS